MSDPTHLSVLLLSGVAFVAGSLDAIAGGGGLLTVPALLAVGLPPHAVLGTNKGQSLFGSLAAIVRYARAGFVDFRSAVVTAPLGFIGSLFGAALVLVIRPAVLRPIVLGLLLVAGVFVAFARPRVPGTTPLAWRARAIGGLLALAIGAYDGFFGPGTGTFLIAGFVAFLGLSPTRASADAKVVNFASNVAAAALFASRGDVIWKIALPMAGAQILGGTLGAHLAVRRGDRLIRQAVFVVVVALVIKLARDAYLGR